MSTDEQHAEYNPGKRSPKKVVADTDYKLVHTKDGHSFSGAVTTITVKHEPSKTYWQTIFSVGLDDSDYGAKANWHEVHPRQQTITTYERK